jgi:TP901-1 family phage major tail protein
MGMNGTDIIVYIDGVAVGSQRDCSMEETTETIDMSSKDSRAGRYEPGRYGATLTLDALYVPTDTAYASLSAAMRNGTKVEVVVVEDGVALESADAVVTSLGRSAPDQGEATISAAMTLDGEWTSGS